MEKMLKKNKPCRPSTRISRGNRKKHKGSSI